MSWIVVLGALCGGVFFTMRYFPFKSRRFKVGMATSVSCLAYVVGFVAALIVSSSTSGHSANARETALEVFGLESGKQYPLALSEDEAPAEGFFIEVNHAKNSRGDLLITFRHPQKEDQALEIPEQEVDWSQQGETGVTLDLDEELLDSGRWEPVAGDCNYLWYGPLLMCEREISYGFRADPFPDLKVVVQKGFTTNLFAGNPPQVRISVTAKQYVAIHGQPSQ